MNKMYRVLALSTLMITLPFTASVAKCRSNSQAATCCGGGMGGIDYCDSSGSRYVCKNGDYSVCYCTRHTVMDLQKLAGCCLWHGGVVQIDPQGVVICQDGSFSEECTLQSPPEKIVSW